MTRYAAPRGRYGGRPSLGIGRSLLVLLLELLGFLASGLLAIVALLIVLNAVPGVEIDVWDTVKSLWPS